MNVTIALAKRTTPEEVRDFPVGPLPLDFQSAGLAPSLRSVASAGGRTSHGKFSARSGAGPLMSMPGHSRSQPTRPAMPQRDAGWMQGRRRNVFGPRFTQDDEILPAETDNLHGLSAETPRESRLRLPRDERCERLATISRSRPHNLRRRSFHRSRRRRFAKTRPVPIGIRRKPRPDSRLAFPQSDAARQGDLEGAKRMHRLNVVDEATWMRYAIRVPRVVERCMAPSVQRALDRFPFVIHGFLADSGSKFIDSRRQARATHPDERIMTPFETWKSPPVAGKHLKPGIAFVELNAIARECDDNDAVRWENAARAELFKLIDWGSDPASPSGSSRVRRQDHAGFCGGSTLGFGGGIALGFGGGIALGFDGGSAPGFGGGIALGFGGGSAPGSGGGIALGCDGGSAPGSGDGTSLGFDGGSGPGSGGGTALGFDGGSGLKVNRPSHHIMRRLRLTLTVDEGGKLG